MINVNLINGANNLKYKNNILILTSTDKSKKEYIIKKLEEYNYRKVKTKKLEDFFDEFDRIIEDGFIPIVELEPYELKIIINYYNEKNKLIERASEQFFIFSIYIENSDKRFRNIHKDYITLDKDSLKNYYITLETLNVKDNVNDLIDLLI